MNTHTPQGEIRPLVTSGDPYAEPFVVPLLRLRGYDRQIIQPEVCLVPGCLVCAWRKAGLLDAPVTRVVREPSSGYTCHSAFCPGCNTLVCCCMTPEQEDAIAEHAYQLGHEHGLADGPGSRPSRRWLTDVGLDAESYWLGYDDGCDGLPLHTLPADKTLARLWDDRDDGMPI